MSEPQASAARASEPQPPLPGPLNLLSKAAWQTVLLVGVVSMVLGIIVLVWPKATLLVVGVLFGLYLVIIGIGQLFAAFGTHASTAMRVLAFISGSLCILLGLFCFRGVFESLLLLAVWIGIGWLFRGLMQMMAGISDPDMPARGWQIFLGVLNAIAGIIVLVWPVGSLAALTIFTGCWLLVIGVFEIATAIALRSHAKKLPQSV